jgi:hypothetical protein
MTIKYILAVALVAPFMTVSGVAQTVDQHVYQGGSKTTNPRATRSMTTSPSEALGMVPAPVRPRAKRSHIYNGGPQTVVPHSY